jgi:hypothetical protein
MIQKKLPLLLALISISGLSAVYGSTVVVPGVDAATEPGSKQWAPVQPCDHWGLKQTL